jgi:hypothetical protein
MARGERVAHQVPEEEGAALHPERRQHQLLNGVFISACAGDLDDASRQCDGRVVVREHPAEWCQLLRRG